jgi:hypothetical protein
MLRILINFWPGQFDYPFWWFRFQSASPYQVQVEFYVHYCLWQQCFRLEQPFNLRKFYGYHLLSRRPRFSWTNIRFMCHPCLFRIWYSAQSFVKFFHLTHLTQRQLSFIIFWNVNNTYFWFSIFCESFLSELLGFVCVCFRVESVRI